MNNATLKIYHSLPVFFRETLVSSYGLYLKQWRYGNETEKLVQEAIEREHWNPAQWKKWREERLAFVLHRAATKVPYYQQMWAERRRKGDRSSWEILENWAILEKESVRKNPNAFLANDCNPKKMYQEHTSGTTGTPLNLWWSLKTVRSWYALFEARWRRWYGVSRKDPWAILGGQLVVPFHQTKPPFWVWNAPMNQLYLSTYHQSLTSVSSYLNALKRYQIQYMYSYSSALYELAKYILHLGKPLKMKVVITNAEPLYQYQRQVISRAFNCPVRETYGMAEIVVAAGECESGNLHSWPEVGFVESASDAGVSERDTTRDFICTSLLNIDMPFIRYKLGDRGYFSNEHNLCTCSRTLPVIERIEGRTNDVLRTRDGRTIYWLNPVFYDFPIHEAQIIQEDLDKIRVRYVPDDGFNSNCEVSIAERLRERLGDIEVVFEKLEKIPRGANGKFRAVISNLSLSRD